MENEKEIKYYIIWLYISILLHLLLVIIMLATKPVSLPSQDPDPAPLGADETQVIFIDDKPEEPVETFKMSTRIQGAQIATHQDSQEAQKDGSTESLSDEYKKNITNQTDQTEHDPDGTIDIKFITPENQDQEEASTQKNDTTAQSDEVIDKPSKNKHTTDDTRETSIAAEEIFKSIFEETQQQKIESQELKRNQQIRAQKLVSKKHRPANVGLENLSKIHLTKPKEEIATQKKKISLIDIQQSFNQLMRSGNEENFSRQGNAQEDDAIGLKHASYMRQAGQIYKNAHATFPEPFVYSKDEKPVRNSTIILTVERSGKISAAKQYQSCGIVAIDEHHMKIIKFMGDLPPIPKFLEAPYKIPATLYFNQGQESFTQSLGSPSVLQEKNMPR